MISRYLGALLLALALASIHGPASARGLSDAEVATLRDSNGDPRMPEWHEARKLAEALGKEQNLDALPLLLELRNSSLMHSFVAGYQYVVGTKTPTPDLEPLALKLARDPSFARDDESWDTRADFFELLGNKYRSRELFDLFYASVRRELTSRREGYSGMLPPAQRSLGGSVITSGVKGIDEPIAALLPLLSDACQGHGYIAFLGDHHYLPATDRLIEYLEGHGDRPREQLRFETDQRLPLASFPVPAYHMLPLREYFIANIQFSSGCPYSCEFCDIPALYGRNPRLKTPEQICRELDLIADAGCTSVYFVDDNFIGNQKAALELLPHLVAWQQRRRYPVRFACEATLNIAKNERVLALMRDAGFITVFCGIETPEPQALRFMSKDQNLRMPILEAVERLNAHGLEVVSGIILGLDTDTLETAEHIIEFIRESRIPLLTINVLYALPKTPLWRRLEADGRLVPEAALESNVAFRLPYDTVIDMWRRCITAAYEPEAVYARFAHQVAHTYTRRLDYPTNPQRASWENIRMALAILARLFWSIGVCGDYRRTFWKMAWPALRAGNIESLIQTAVVSHHLIQYTRDCVRGLGESSFYAPGAAPAVPQTGASEAAAV